MHRPIAVLLLAVALVRPGGAAAVGAIPPEDRSVLLERPTISAIVADVDGDGVRELVRVVPRSGNQAEVAVDVIGVIPDAVADRTMAYAEARLLRVADVDEQLGGGPPAVDGLLPVRIDDPARLVVWRDGGREHVIVVTIGILQGRSPCCLTVWGVELSGGAVELVRMPGTVGSAVFVRVADLDGDGTDELVVLRPPDVGRAGRAALAAYRWTGDRFAGQELTLDPNPAGPLIALGDSDGLPGEEVGLVGQRTTGLTGTPVLSRLGMDAAGVLRPEQAGLPFAGDVIGIEGADGPRLVLASGDLGSEILNWPAGQAEMSEEHVSIRHGVPVAVLGTGTRARLLLSGVEGTMDVLDAELQPLQGVVGLEAAALFRGSQLAAYVGPVPGGIDGAPSYIFRGRMVQPIPDPDSRGLNLLAEARIASLPGVVPIGLLGADQAWMALAADPRFDATRDGGTLDGPVGPPRGARVTLAPRAAVFQEEVDGGELVPPLDGALPSDRQPARPLLLSGGNFGMRIAAPPGTSITPVVDDVTGPSQPVPESGTLSLQVAAPGEGNRRFTLRLLAVTPSGHGYGGLWEVQVLQRPPSLTASAATLSLSFEVPVAGTTDPGARVTVDGAQVAVASDGSFNVTVPGGFTPRRVEIAAVDPLGNQAQASVSVVAVYDYRTLPWIPMVALLTVIVGGVLYLRAPRPAPVPARRPEDGTLEEIE